jgi:hypothetical protein
MLVLPIGGARSANWHTRPAEEVPAPMPLSLRQSTLASLTVLAAAVSAPSAHAALPNTICGQLKGPYASWVSTEPPKGTVAGTTWTVLAQQGTPCRTAVAATPALLAQWARHHGKYARLRAPGWVCVVTPSPGRSGSGGFACVKGKQLYAVFETGRYTVAQLRRLGVEQAG